MNESQLLEQFLQLAELTSSTETFFQIRERVARWFQDLLNAQKLAIFTAGRGEHRTLEVAAVLGFSGAFERFFPQTAPILFDELPGYLQETFIRGTPLEISDVERSSLVDRDLDLARSEGYRAIRCWPLIARASVMGVLCTYTPQPLQLASPIERIVKAGSLLVANLMDRDRMVIEQEELYEQIEQIRYVDPQTGLYNRRYFRRVLQVEVSRAQRYHRPLSCLLFEIDHLPRILETYGTEVAEGVIAEFARLLKAASRESDVLCSYATGKFALLAVETPIQGAVVFGERLLDLIREKHFAHGTQIITVTASAGIASMPHPEIQSMEQILDAAERMLLAAAEAGGDQYQVYE